MTRERRRWGIIACIGAMELVTLSAGIGQHVALGVLVAALIVVAIWGYVVALLTLRIMSRWYK